MGSQREGDAPLLCLLRREKQKITATIPVICPTSSWFPLGFSVQRPSKTVALTPNRGLAHVIKCVSSASVFRNLWSYVCRLSVFVNRTYTHVCTAGEQQGVTSRTLFLKLHPWVFLLPVVQPAYVTEPAKALWHLTVVTSAWFQRLAAGLWLSYLPRSLTQAQLSCDVTGCTAAKSCCNCRVCLRVVLKVPCDRYFHLFIFNPRLQWSRLTELIIQKPLCLQPLPALSLCDTTKGGFPELLHELTEK